MKNVLKPTEMVRFEIQPAYQLAERVAGLASLTLRDIMIQTTTSLHE